MTTQTDFVRQVIAAIHSVTGNKHAVLHEPCFSGNEWLYLKECLDSTFVSSGGPFVDRFEADLAHFTGAKHAVAVVNGTAALHIALLMANVKPGDEVIAPALTFIATANAIAYCNAIPHFADSEESTLGLDPDALRQHLADNTEQHNGQCINCHTGRVIRAVVAMHTFGHPVRLEELMAVAKDFNLALIEDAAESLGSYYHGKHTGTFGLLGTLSFNGNKTITTGGGGAILTDDIELARRAKHLTTTAKLPHAWQYLHDEIGYNYRLPNLNAALGCAQLEQLPGFLSAKRNLTELYAAAFASIEGVSLKQEPANCISNYWLQTLILDASRASHHDALLQASNQDGLMTRPAWNLMHQLKPYLDCPRMPLPRSERLAACMINIPSSVTLIKESMHG